MDSPSGSIQWFPGHMDKTRRTLKSSLKACDGVVEIIDSRIPISSQNPEIDKIIGSKKRIILMNKCDMADKSQNKKWLEFFERNNTAALAVDCKTGRGLKAFVPATRELLRDELQKWRNKGMKGRNLKVMVVGIPNVGKSSFINRMAKNIRAKVEDRPGVTKKNQWYTIEKGFEMLDTPGVLWPKFDDEMVGENLAFTGAIDDRVMDIEELTCVFLDRIKKEYGHLIAKRYKLGELTLETIQSREMLEMIAKRRGMVAAGGEPDTDRAANMIMNEFRTGILGAITLETTD